MGRKEGSERNLVGEGSRIVVLEMLIVMIEKCKFKVLVLFGGIESYWFFVGGGKGKEFWVFLGFIVKGIF